MQTITNSVPFLDLKNMHAGMAERLAQVFDDVVNKGTYILGEPVELFEAEFARYQHSRFCVGVGNGLDAISLALRALGVGPGDDVLVPSNTFIATWLAVSHVGANPVAVEPDPATHLVTAETLRAAMTLKTKAAIVVHLYGQTPEMDPIVEFCRTNKLYLLEDAAQAHGAEYKGKRAGSFGDAGSFSFYPGKNLGALGDGGAITTNDENLAGKIRLLRNYGSSRKYIHEQQGFNSRLDTLQAAILSSKLQFLDEWNARRAQIAAAYLEQLRAVSGLTLPAVHADCKPVWHLFVIRHKKRDELQERLGNAGVQTLIHYPVPPHLQEAYNSEFAGANLPVAETLAKEILSLPMGPHLSDEQVSYVCQTLKTICQEL